MNIGTCTYTITEVIHFYSQFYTLLVAPCAWEKAVFNAKHILCLKMLVDMKFYFSVEWER